MSARMLRLCCALAGALAWPAVAHAASFDAVSPDGSVYFDTAVPLVEGDNDTARDIYERVGQTTQFVSTGPTDADANENSTFDGLSADGSRVFFTTKAPLVPEDIDLSLDVYERSGGVTKLVSTGPLAGGGLHAAQFEGASADGSRVFFSTTEQISPADTDDLTDFYERSAGTTTLLTPTPLQANGITPAFAGASADGTRVFITTYEKFAASDTDGDQDVYELSGGTAQLVSQGPNGESTATSSTFAGASADGTHVFFATFDPLMPTDTDASRDVYERFGGTTAHVSVGANTAGASEFRAASADGSRVIFDTVDQLAAGDTDATADLYQRAGGVTTLVSPGGTGAGGVSFEAASTDATHVFYSTTEQHTGDDTDSVNDVYERFNGVTTRVSAGAINGPGANAAAFASVTPDGSHVYFRTAETLEAADDDQGGTDLYQRTGGVTSLVSVTTAGTAGNPAVSGGTASPDGSRVVFTTAESFLPGDADTQDVFARTAGTTSLVSGLLTGDAALAGLSADGEHAVFGTVEPLLPGDGDFTQDYFDRFGGATSRLSTGPTDAGAPQHASGGRLSADGSRFLFQTAEPLVAADTDTKRDVYERAGGVTSLVSVGNGAFDATLDGISPDGTRTFFSTAEALSGGDVNGVLDLYQRQSGTTTLIGPTNAQFRGVSPDGTRVVVLSSASGDAADTDGTADLYEWSNGAVSWVSQGPVSSNGAFIPAFNAVTPTGVVFSTAESLVPADGDTVTDVYLRAGGVTTQVSAGAVNGNGNAPADFGGASADGSRIFFTSSEKLAAEDTDTDFDVYERSGGTTKLVSISSSATQPGHAAVFAGASADGTHVFYTTSESQLNADGESLDDIYERFAGTTSLISVGDVQGTPAQALFYRVSADGTRVLWSTTEALTAGDGDTYPDVYERSAGKTTLVSQGQINGDGAFGASPAGMSADGSKVFFRTQEQLVSTDKDGTLDIYERSGGATYHVSTGTVSPVPPMPTVLSADPASPANAATVAIRGSAASGTVVKLYATGDCSGTPVATGPAGTFAGPGLPVGVPQNATLTYRATATGQDDYTSACSTTSVTFTEDSTAPAPPVIGASNPASPADDATPQLSGTAEPGSTVNLYATADCSGSPMATGTAAEFAAPGLTIVVAEGTTTAVRATATDVAGNVSGCGNAFSYVKTVPFLAPPVIIEKPVEKPVETPVQTPLAKDTTPPETKLTSVPKPTITATRATFRFSASEAGSTFRCRLDKKPFTVCRSPATYKKLKLGKHTFQVVAVDAAGNADPTPASKRFRVKKRRR